MDRLESMSVFAAVATAGSFSGAARALRMPLPTVSRKVAELEAHLGAPLLLRSTRRLALTEPGALYLQDCRRLLQELADAEQRARGEHNLPRGELVLSAPLAFGRLHLLPVVGEFLKRHGEVSARLLLTDQSLDLPADHVEAALRIGELPDSRLVAIRIGGVRQVVCASPGYLSARGRPASPAQLARHDCISFERLGDPGDWAFGDQARVRLRPRITVNTAEAAIDAALAGLGFTRVLSYQVDAALKSGRLEAVLQRFEPPPLPVHLVHASESRPSAKLRAFIAFAPARLRSRLGG